jgi:hypothetical protein
MTRRPTLCREAKLADFGMMETVSWKPILEGCCFLLQHITLAYNTIYDPYPFPFSSPAAP